MANISVIHSVGRFDREAGGTTTSIANLCSQLARLRNVNVSLVSQTFDHGLEKEPPLPGVHVYMGVGHLRGLARLGGPFRPAYRRALAETPPSILHDHGIWRLSNHYVADLARKLSIPRVVHPRGMLEPWALTHHRWRKRMALWLYQYADLRSTTLFFATATQEHESIRKLGLRQPVAIVPNGVQLPSMETELSCSSGQSEVTRNALFLSRIHQKKGVLTLLESWARVGPAGWRLLIAGPDDGGHLVDIERRIDALGLRDSVKYVGFVEGACKEALFRSADLFVLPSYSENFGNVIAEALAYEIPVITTTATPWAELVRRNCGWWVDPAIDTVSEALGQATRMNQYELKSMGRRGRQYVREFDWQVVAQRTVDVYEWLLGRNSCPSFVALD